MEEKLKIRRVNYFLKKCSLANYNNIRRNIIINLLYTLHDDVWSNLTFY